MKKQVHYYDNDNLYTVSEPAYLNVQETKRLGKDVYYCPEMATLEELPSVGEHQIQQFDGEKWNVISDYRHEYQVNENMELSEITYLGDIKEGHIYVTKEQADKILNDKYFYIVQDGEIVENPNYEEEKAQQEQDRINNLTMTALDFIGVLQGFGLTLEQINAYLESNLAVKIQLTYCQNVYCGVVKQLMPISVGDITITADMVEIAFRIKNGEEIK